MPALGVREQLYGQAGASWALCCAWTRSWQQSWVLVAIGLLSVFFQVKQELNRQEGAHLVVLSLQWVVWGTGKLCKFKLNGCESDWALEGQWSADLMGGGKIKPET